MLAHTRRRYLVIGSVLLIFVVLTLIVWPGPVSFFGAHPRPLYPLTAKFTYAPSLPEVGQEVSFTGSASGGIPPHVFSWDLGDSSTGSGANFTHTYTAPGSYAVTLKTRDPNGQGASLTRTVLVTNPTPSAPPQIVATYSYSYNNSIATLQPHSGSIFLIVHLTITDEGYQNFTANPFDMYVMINGQAYNVSAAYLFLPHPFLPLNLMNTQSASGDVVFEVPIGSTTFTPAWRVPSGITLEWR